MQKHKRLQSIFDIKEKTTDKKYLNYSWEYLTKDKEASITSYQQILTQERCNYVKLSTGQASDKDDEMLRLKAIVIKKVQIKLAIVETLKNIIDSFYEALLKYFDNNHNSEKTIDDDAEDKIELFLQNYINNIICKDKTITSEKEFPKEVLQHLNLSHYRQKVIKLNSLISDFNNVTKETKPQNDFSKKNKNETSLLKNISLIDNFSEVNKARLKGKFPQTLSRPSYET